MSIKAYSSYTVVDIVDGIQWQDDATSHPTNPKEGWAYYNTKYECSYIYDGEKWVVFAKDGKTPVKGEDYFDGDGISDEIIQYCQHDSAINAPTSGWTDEFPTVWDNDNQYVWKRIKQVWTSKDSYGNFVIKYTAPQLVSQIEVATNMAMENDMTLDEWCIENDVTIISGSQIATGTITADHIKINDLYTLNATIGGWGITSDGLVYGDGIGFSKSLCLYPNGKYYSVGFAGSDPNKTWKMTIGSQFGIDDDGTLYATGANITGRVTATSGYIGNTGTGLAIEGNALKNVYNYNNNQYYMESPSNLNSTDANAGGSYYGSSHDYVYVGTNGIGTLRVAFNVDSNKIVSQTYIQNGELHTNAGIIGDENSDYKWTIGYNDNSAYLYCKDSSVASMGGILAPASNGVYLGTDGLSYTLCNDSGLDYTTVVKAGNILTYGTNEGSGDNNRAIHTRYDGISFFNAGTNTISTISNLSDFKVGGIEIGTDNSLNIRAKKLVFDDESINSSNSIEITHLYDMSTVKSEKSLILSALNNLHLRSESYIYINTGSGIYSSGYLTKTGWMKVRCYASGGNTAADRYLRFMNGMLVDVKAESPTGTVTWLA
jgi:hypothetical protein